MKKTKLTRTALFQSILALHLHNRGLIGDGRNEPVVHKNNRIEFDATLDNEVCNTSGISKSGNVSADLIESDVVVGVVLSNKLTLGLVADDRNGGVFADFGALRERGYGPAVLCRS
jgi:hypothetical protein